MSQLKIKQIFELQAALDGKIGTGANLGSGTGTVFKEKNGTTLRFNTLGNGLGVKVNTPSSDIITLDIDLNTITNTETTASVGDLIAMVDVSDNNLTKLITRANFVAGLGSGAVAIGDYTSESSTQATDSIIFFDNSDSNSAKRQTKTQFLSDYTPLASPSLTGTPLAPTASVGTNNTQIATTAFVNTAVDNAIMGFDFQSDVLNTQTNSSLNPSASPATGARYIIENASSLHSNFGTISGLGNDDIVEYNGSAFFVAYDASVKGEGVLVYDQNANEYKKYDGSAWTIFGGLEGLVAGAGLTKSGNTLNVGSGAGITVNADSIQISATYTGQTSITTLGTIATGSWNATTIPLNKGGTGLTTLATNTVLTSQGSANTLSPLTLAAHTLLGRAGSNIAALSGTDVQRIAQKRTVLDSGTLTAGSMTLGTLSQTPGSGTQIQVFINGLLIEQTTHYTRSGTTISATNALNIAYGGSAADGNGFANGDRFVAVYEY